MENFGIAFLLAFIIFATGLGLTEIIKMIIETIRFIRKSKG